MATLLVELDTTGRGLTADLARARLVRYGRNELREDGTRSVLIQLLRRFRNPLVLILMVASVVSAASGEVASSAIIVAMVAMSVLLDFVQEYRAGQAALRLRQSVQIRPAVFRDGLLRNVPVGDVVPGDVVHLSSGNLVPADGRLLDTSDLFVNQALLTGEAFPVEKHAGEAAEPASRIEDATNVAFMGTAVISGTGRLLVCRTGQDTALGEIAHSLELDPPPTAFERGTRQFGMLIMRLTVLMVLFVLLVNAVSHKPLLESFLFAVALAVGLTPELLPMVISVTLARGAQRMAKKHVVVKRLPAIQNLGSMDVFCTDKTGTLTDAKIALERHVDIAGRDSARVLDLAGVNSFFEAGHRNALDEAILSRRPVDIERWTKIDEVPFDFERRRVSVLVDDETRRLLVVKGAPEDVLSLCTGYETSDASGTRALDATARNEANAQLDALGKNGLRVLAIAYRTEARDQAHASIGDERELVLVGFAAFLDPPKATAAQALAAMAASGVSVKIVTGDTEIVTRFVCARLGVRVTGVLTGAEMATIGDAALQARVDSTNLFCRVNPAEKTRVILALKARGHVVGYLGDGINDAPALQAADVGVSVDGAVDVAKEAADMILLRHDLRVLHDGVLEGRRTFANVRKYIMMGTSSNFGNMFSMAAASVFLPFLPMLPGQILLNNVLYDLSEVAIPLDRVDAVEVRGPQVWDMRFIRNFMWVMGPLSSVFDLLTFYVLLEVLDAGESLFQSGWFVESLATQVLVIFVIRTRGNPLASRPHVVLAISSVAVVIVAIALPFTGLGRELGFRPLPAQFLLILAGLVATYLGAAEVAKRLFYRHLRARGHLIRRSPGRTRL